MEKIDLKKLNEIVMDYIIYLYDINPIFLYNSLFFEELSKFYEEYKLPEIDFKFKKMNASESFNLVREFYLKYYHEDMNYLEQLFNSGVFNIFYKDELKEEKIYLEEVHSDSSQGKKDKNSFINLALEGNILDVLTIAHEIRHQLNQPNTYRNTSNDNLTEALSIFDELLLLDFLETKIGLEEASKLKKFYFNRRINKTKFNNVNFVAKSIYIKRVLDYINEEKYKILFGKEDLEEYFTNCSYFLSSHSTCKDMDEHLKNRYVFGIFLASFMHQEYLKDENYLEKFKLLNKGVRDNEDIVEVLKIVNIDLESDNIIENLRNSLINEIKGLENIKKCK